MKLKDVKNPLKEKIIPKIKEDVRAVIREEKDKRKEKKEEQAKPRMRF